SNGPVAYEYLWQQLTGHRPGSSGGVLPSEVVPVLPPTGAVDFAFGGTGTGFLDPLPGGFSAPGLQGQVELFRTQLAGATPSERALYAIFTGANDYLNPLNNRAAGGVVANIGHAIATLHALGGRDVIPMNLPALGLGPFAGDNRAQLSEISTEHNKLLKVMLRKLSPHLKGLNVIEVDPNLVLGHWLPPETNTTLPVLDVFYPPELFGSTGFRMSLCMAIDSATCADIPTFTVPQPGYLFRDFAHPTTQVHELYARLMYRAINE